MCVRQALTPCSQAIQLDVLPQSEPSGTPPKLSPNRKIFRRSMLPAEEGRAGSKWAIVRDRYATDVGNPVAHHRIFIGESRWL